MSGAGMSCWGPMKFISSAVKRRVMRASSFWESSRGLAPHAALGAAVGQPQQGAFPRHPHRERRALPEVDGVVVAHAALRRAEHRGMPHPIRREGAVRAVVHLDWHGHDQRALGRAQAVRDEVGDARVGERVVELRQRLPVEGRVPLESEDGLCDLGHGVKLAPTRRADPNTATASLRPGGRRPATGTRPARPHPARAPRSRTRRSPARAASASRTAERAGESRPARNAR